MHTRRIGMAGCDNLIVDFLVNGSMPKPGTTCAARPISFAAGE
jgi:hypothetical protein